MARPLRFVPTGHVVEVTCRTLQERALLRPSPALNEIALGVLGRAQRRYGLRIHVFVFMSNHYHLLASPEDALQLARFMAYLNANLAKEVSRLHRWKGKVWARRYRAIVLSQEEEAQVGRLRYILAHGVKEGLVRSPSDWPGAHCVVALRDGVSLEGSWFDRSLEHKARRRSRRTPDRPQVFPEQESLRLSPLPCWEGLDEGKRRDRIRDLLHQVEAEGAREVRARGRIARLPRRPSILRQNPHSRPRAAKRTSAPAFHAATASAREALRAAYRWFVQVFRAAAERLRGGDPSPGFPEGSFPPGLPFVSVRAG